MQPTSVTKKRLAWKRATATARGRKVSQGLVRLESWLPQELKERLEEEAASRKLGRDTLLKRILKGHWGENQEVSAKPKEEAPVPMSDPPPPKRSETPPKEKEWLACDDIEKLRNLASRARLKYDRQYRRATKLDSDRWPKIGGGPGTSTQKIDLYPDHSGSLAATLAGSAKATHD